MRIGKLVLAQLMDFLTLHKLRRCVESYASNYEKKLFASR